MSKTYAKTPPPAGEEAAPPAPQTPAASAPAGLAAAVVPAAPPAEAAPPAPDAHHGHGGLYTTAGDGTRMLSERTAEQPTATHSKGA